MRCQPAAPVFSSLTAAPDPSSEGGEVALAGAFSDTDESQTHEAAIDWGDGSPIQTVSLGGSLQFNVTHQYLNNQANNAAFPIAVTLTDSGSESALANTAVVVTNVAPTLSNVAAAAIDENGVAHLTGTIADPGLDAITLTVNWGEGAPENFTFAAGTTSFDVTHQYLDDDPTSTPADIYDIALTVTDADQAVGTASCQLTVSNAAPVLGTVTLTEAIDEAGAATLSGTFSDPGTLDTFTLFVNWGDGVTETFAYAAGSTSFSKTHVYADDGPWPGNGTLADAYTVSFTLTDDDTGSVGDSLPLTVHNVAPALQGVQLTASGCSCGSYYAQLTGTISDPGIHDALTLEVTWGDASVEMFTLAAGATSFDLAHEYTAAGAIVLAVAIIDDDGGTDEVTQNVTLEGEAYTEVYWVGLGDGTNWNDAENWNVNRLPGACDDVFIYTRSLKDTLYYYPGQPNPTVTHSVGTVAIRSLHSDTPITFTGSLALRDDSETLGAFTFNGTMDFLAAADFTFSGGGDFAGELNASQGSDVGFSGGSYSAWDGTLFRGTGSYIVGNALGGGAFADTFFSVFGTVTATHYEMIQINVGGVVQKSTLAGPGTFLVTDTFKWNGGTMSGTGRTTIGSDAILSIYGTDDKYLSRNILKVQGSVEWFSGDIIVESAQTTIENFGNFNMNGDLFLKRGLTVGGNPNFLNYGVFRKTTGSTVGYFFDVDFYNNGSVQILNGAADLVFRGDEGHHTGTFDCADGSTIYFDGDGGFSTIVHTFVPSAGSDMLRGAGFYVAELNVTIDVLADVRAENFRLLNSSLIGPGTFSAHVFYWEGGIMATPGPSDIATTELLPGDIMYITPSHMPGVTAGTRALIRRNIINKGQILWEDGHIDLSLSANIVNDGGAFVIRETSNKSIVNAGAAGKITVKNGGMLSKEIVGTSSATEIFVLVENDGGTMVARDVLELTGGYNMINGATKVFSTTLTVSGNYWQQNGATTVESGTLSIVNGQFRQLNGSTVITDGALLIPAPGNGNGSTHVKLVSGTFRFERSNIGLGAAIGGIFDIDAGATVNCSGIIDGRVQANSGTMKLLGDLFISGYYRQEGAGTLDLNGYIMTTVLP